MQQPDKERAKGHDTRDDPCSIIGEPRTFQQWAPMCLLCTIILAALYSVAGVRTGGVSVPRASSPSYLPASVLSRTKGDAVLFVADMPVEASQVGYGNLGLGMDLGFEGLKLKHMGTPYYHGVSTHAARGGAKNGAFARFNIADIAAQAQTVLFSAVVAINDNNNFVGKAGSKLFFTLRAPNGQVLWRSKGLIKTLTEDSAVDIDVSGYDSITLQVDAMGSNACAHAVWVDPTITIR